MKFEFWEPLTWEKLTRASQVMLPTYVGMFGIVGLNFLLTDKSRLMKSSGLAFADQIVDLRGWGAMFLASALLMLVALIAHLRFLFLYALNLAALCMFLWAVVLGCSAINGSTSPSGWAWPAFVMAACLASRRSVGAGEHR